MPLSDVRQALIDATYAVLLRGGIREVTPTSVAREAQLPEAAVVDHFSSVDDLLAATMRYLDKDLAQALARCERADDPVAAFADFLVADFDDQRPRMIVKYELFIHASRNPSMLPIARRWLADLNDLVSTWTESRRATRTIVAYADGLLVQALISGERLDPRAVEATLKDLL
ncbi:MAG: hypothetical protein WKF73_20885 [Nocardioidaceae bacterium]